MKLNTRFLKYSVIFPALLSSSAVIATQQGDILMRVRVIDINPQSTSGELYLNGSTFLPAGSVEVKDNPSIDVDFTYFVTNHFGIELLLDITSEHTAYIPGVGDVVDTKVLPPSLIAQYHSAPNSSVRPYVGVGVNYTLFLDESSTSTLDTVMGGKTDVELDASTGLVFQAGVDWDINDKWFANLDFKKIDINTTATMTGGGNVAKVDLSIDPVVIGFGIGTKF